MATRISIGTGALTPTPTNPWAISGTVEVGDVVYQVSGADKTVARAKADDAAKRPPMGMVFGKSNGTVLVAGNGDLASGLSGLTTGTVYWLSTTAGQLVDTKPASNAYLVGVATSPTELLVGFTAADLTAGAGGGSGTVTSVGVASADSSLSVSGSPITSSGSVTVDLATVAVADGGAGLTSTSEGALLLASSSGAYVAQTASPFMRNRLINGAHMVSQRYVDRQVQPAGAEYMTDRWIGSNGLTYSGYFDGSGDYLSVANNALLQFGSGDFTFECWFYIAANSAADASGERTASILTSSSAASEMVLLISGNASTTGTGFRFYWYTGGSYVFNIGVTVSISQGQWHHFAVCRSSSAIKVYYDGVQQGSTVSSSANVSPDAAFEIGRLNVATYNRYLNGYISNLRIVKGTAVYTSNFTPSTIPLTAIANTSLLTCASSTFLDKSSNAFTVTANGNAAVNTLNPFPNLFRVGRSAGWSNYFDGSGDYLSVANNASLQFGSGDFTFDTWFYISGNSSAGADGFRRGLLFGSPYVSTTQLNIEVYGDSSTTGTGIYFAYYASGAYQIEQTRLVAIAQQQWHHLAVCRASGQIRIFLNGVQQGASIASATNIAPVEPLRIGRFTDTAGYLRDFNGYISNLRIVKGTALYTANFTPSTMPLVPVANTSLLTCGSETFQDKSSNNFAITAVGNAAVTSQSPFTVAPTGFTAGLQWSVLTPASASAADTALISQRVEGTSVYDLAWGTASAKAVTLSFWVRSPVTGTYCISLRNSAATHSYVAEYSISAADTWEKKTIQVSGPTVGAWLTTTGIGIVLGFDVGSGTSFNTTADAWQSGNFFRTTNQTNFVGTALASGVQANNFLITGVQLEAGNATPFEFRPMQAEMALCQRYFARLGSLSGNYVGFGNGVCAGTTVGWIFLKYPVTMRSQPIIDQSDTCLYDTAAHLITSLSGTYAGLNSAQVSAVSSGLTTQRAVIWCGNNNPNAYVQLDAEL